MSDAVLDKLAEVSALACALGKSLAEFGSAMMKEGGQPLAEVPKEEAAPKEETDPVAEKKDLPKLEDVRAVLADISRTGKTAEMKALLTKFGATKLSDIPAERYPELLSAAEAIRDA